MSIDRRKALIVFGRGAAIVLAPALAAGRTLAQAPARERKPAQTPAEPGPEEADDKNKSGLVDDTEAFGRGRTRAALLLPDIEGPYRFAADAVLRGIMAAHTVDGKGVSVKVVRLKHEDFNDVAQVYRQLQRERIQHVIGPLLRSEVNGLARLSELPLPTLALNLPDREHGIAGNCVLFSLAVEYDGRSAAQFAFAELFQRIGNLRPIRALTISDTSELSRRSADAFIDGWQSFGGQVEPAIVRDVDTEAEMRKLLSGVRADMVFIAVEPEVLRVIRPAFSAQMPLYGTSQLNIGATPTVANAQLLAAPDLDGVRVVEMPWQLEPQHPAVAVYPRSSRLPHVEMQRLYAFGIDAWRLSREMIAGTRQISLDGVTGRLWVDRDADARVIREPVLGEYRQGILAPAYASATVGQPAPAPVR